MKKHAIFMSAPLCMFYTVGALVGALVAACMYSCVMNSLRQEQLLKTRREQRGVMPDLNVLSK